MVLDCRAVRYSSRATEYHPEMYSITSAHAKVSFNGRGCHARVRNPQIPNLHCVEQIHVHVYGLQVLAENEAM